MKVKLFSNLIDKIRPFFIEFIDFHKHFNTGGSFNALTAKDG